MYVSEKYEYTVDDEWLGFINEGHIPRNIRPTIFASWMRCKTMGVNPFEVKSRRIYAGEELINKLQAKKHLIDTIKPYMENIYKIVEGSGFIVFLTDEEATVLYVLGDENVLREYKNGSNFCVGASWIERYIGTTSVGMVLKEGKPIQITGSEHYCKEQRKWTCSGVPVKDSNGNIIAVISMAGSKNSVHSHTLGMLVAAEMAIENQLQVFETTEKLLVANRYHTAVVNSVSEGILSIDQHGIITYMNNSAGKILLSNPEEAIGKHISEIVDFRPVILDVLKTGKGYVDKEFIINSKRGRMHFVKSAVPIRGEDGKIDGVVDIFREIRQVKRLVNQMVGAHARFCFNDIMGQSKGILEAKRQALTASKSSSNVLLMGESGTGKELFAQAVHNASSRCKGPFIAVNCGAIPRDLIESEFFGYDEGAFTGARQGGRPGKFEMAAGGTIFLDEIGEMPLDMQVRLLRVLQEKRVIRVGGNKAIPVDVRVIAATNKDLIKEMQEGAFRKDLFWRLNVLTIHIPPLNQRKEDIPLLAEHFLKKHKRENLQCELADETKVILQNYNWPGNVRELENALERGSNFAENGIILPEHLPKNIYNNNSINIFDGFMVKVDTLENIEAQAISKTISYCSKNISKCAKLLGISRNTLYSKIKKYNIDCH